MTISLADKKLEIKQGLIEQLEDLLSEAREGRVETLVFAYTNNKAEFFTGSSFDRPLTAMGLVVALQMDVNQIAIQTEE